MTQVDQNVVDPRSCFPVPNATVPFWRTQLHDIDSHRSTQDLPSHADIVIIGAGLAGTSVAWHILEGNPSPPSIVILEARQVCSGATGRNGGHTKMGYRAMSPNAKKYGKETSIELANFEAAQLFALKSVVEKEEIDCDFVLTRSFETTTVADAADELKQTWREQVQEGGWPLHDVGFFHGENLEKFSKVKGVKAATSTSTASLWPYKLVTSLMAKLVKKGVNLQTHTPVSSVSQSSNDSSIVVTERGSITARKVVYATNAYSAGLLPQFNRTIVPIKGTCTHIDLPKDGKTSPPAYLNHTYGLTTAVGRDYLVPRPDGSIIVGGAGHKFKFDKSLWWNTVDDSTLIPNTKPHFDDLMQRTFNGWEDSGAYLERIWTGIMGYTPDNFPHIGKVPERTNEFLLAGFNGSGMSYIFLSAKALAKMILEGVSYEETGLPLALKCTQERIDHGFKDSLIRRE